MDSTHEETDRRPSKRAIIVVVVIAVILVIFVICLSLASAKTPDPIHDLSELETALKDETHINCTVSHEDEGNFLIQANNGFSKVKVVLYGSDGVNESILAVDDMTYYWDTDGYAFMMSDREPIDELIDELRSGIVDSDVSSGYKISCESPSNSNFAVPTDKDFIDVSE